MVLSEARSFGPLDILGAALSWPPASLAIALLVAGGATIATSRSLRRRGYDHADANRSVRFRYAREHRALGVAAMAVVLLFLTEFVLRGYVLTGPAVWWGRFAVPILGAAIGIGAALGLIATRGSAPEVPVPPTVRRDWWSFNSRSSVTVTIGAVLALVGTTISAGLASSANAEGDYVWLAIPIPNEADVDPIRSPFYGWTYGLPVLLSLAALVATAWVALNRNAARPYQRPETVMVERAARRETAHGTAFLVTGAALLSLAGAWRLIGQGGSGQYLTVTGQNESATYDAAWRFAELAVAAGWGAPLVEITALTILLLVAVKAFRRTPNQGRLRSSTPVPHPSAEVAG